MREGLWALYQYQSEIKHFIIIRLACFSKCTLIKNRTSIGMKRWGKTCSWARLHLSKLYIIWLQWITDCFTRFMPLFALVSKTQYPHILLDGITVATKACWEMFCLPVPPDCQSIKNSEPISLPELFNTNWPLLLRPVNDVCHLNAISTIFY